MELFSLPNSTIVNRVIPKNAFDGYTTTKQKRLFTELIARITWSHKISPDTINLETKEIKEVQIFRIVLKKKQDIQAILDVIDKSIPYNIIFIIEYGNSVYLSTSSKHAHPINEDNSVIDWTFKTEWFQPSENKYTLKLKRSIDAIYHDFCIQISGDSTMATNSLHDLIVYKKNVDSLQRKIAKLKSELKNCKHFNSKVELNLKLKAIENELKTISK